MASTCWWCLFVIIGCIEALEFPNPTNFNGSAIPSKIYDVAAAKAPISYSYTNEELGLLWDQVGKIAIGPITALVEPVPEPATYPRPGNFHPLVPTYDTSLNTAKLPDNFIWGTAGAAYQIEGAVKDEGRGPSIWDLIAHRNVGAVHDNSTGDVVGSHYWLYKQDFARMANMGIPYFSTSFSWPRFFPFGAADSPVNVQGVAHYDDWIAAIVASGVKPIITLFHWDTPLALFNSYGGWTDPRIVDDFFNYAIYVIQRYDAYVPIWYTFNEPQYCNWQYANYPAGNANGLYPAYHNLTTGVEVRFTCGHYTLLAHAKVAKWYHEVFKGRGRISFKNSGNYFEANDTSSAADIDAAARQFAFSIGWFGGPWTDGDYPSILKETLGDILPKFSDAEKALIKGSCDFYAIDGYTANAASALPNSSTKACIANPKDSSFPECALSNHIKGDGFPLGPSSDPQVSWLYSTPTAMRKYLSTITKVLFPSITDIVVSEFGFAEPFEANQPNKGSVLWDLRRADYIQSFLDNILAARVHDGLSLLLSHPSISPLSPSLPIMGCYCFFSVHKSITYLLTWL